MTVNHRFEEPSEADVATLINVANRFNLWRQLRMRPGVFSFTNHPWVARREEPRLDLSHTTVTAKDILALRPLAPFLRRLDLTQTNTGGALVHLPIFHNLTALILDGVQFSNQSDLQHLTELPQLQNLFLHNTNLDDLGLAQLAPLMQSGEPRLKRFSIGRTKVTAEGLRYIGGLQPVGSLVIHDIDVTGEDLIRFRGWKLKRLYVGGPRVDDEVVAVVHEGFEELFEFLLSGSPLVSDESLEALHKILLLAKRNKDDASDVKVFRVEPE